MATAGSGQASWSRISSRAASTQPTVPSPPHTSTRKRGTWANTWSLEGGREGGGDCLPQAGGEARRPTGLQLTPT